MALRRLYNSVFTHALMHTAEEKQQNKEWKEGQKLDLQTQKAASRSFQMPLHYPRFTKNDYERMEEWKVDMLLREYGLENHIKGSLDDKRKFAVGTFLWPHQL